MVIVGAKRWKEGLSLRVMREEEAIESGKGVGDDGLGGREILQPCSADTRHNLLTAEHVCCRCWLSKELKSIFWQFRDIENHYSTITPDLLLTLRRAEPCHRLMPVLICP